MFVLRYGGTLKHPSKTLSSLFDSVEADNRRSGQPLAWRMRPRRLGDYVGQSHLTGDDTLLRRMIDSRTITSLILWGPPGTGKTTLAEIIAAETETEMRRLSATRSGVKDVREVLDWADDRVASGGGRPILFIDEIHRFSRSQQDALLPDVESGTIALIGATTSNPHFAVNAALLSRSQLFGLRAIEPESIRTLLRRAIGDDRDGLAKIIKRNGVVVQDDAIDALSEACEGDARRALGALEIAVLSTGESQTRLTIDRATLLDCLGSRQSGYTDDDHYDLASALIKSIRGSDVDAALYWLARMLEGGEDIRFLTRRLIISASEDIGNADPSALPLAVAAMQACEFIGLPECQLTLSQTVAYLSLAPKSGASTSAIGAALSDVRSDAIVPVPKSLRDAHYGGAADLGHGVGYRSAHKDPSGVVDLDYLGVDRKYYEPVDRGFESELRTRVDALRKRLRPSDQDDRS